MQCVWPYLSSKDANWRKIWLGELSRVLGCSGEALSCHFSSSLSSIFFFSSCSYVVRFTHFGVDVTEPILMFTFWLLIYVYCSLSSVLFYALMLVLAWSPFAWRFELSLGNAFELRNGEEHLMGFMPRDRTKLVSHFVTLVLKANHLVRLVKGLIVWSRGLDSFYPRDRDLSIFMS